LKNVDKGKLYKTVGWATVALGLYIVGIGVSFDNVADYVRPGKSGDDIFDAEFTIIDD
jgi:hypothetical protein